MKSNATRDKNIHAYNVSTNKLLKLKHNALASRNWCVTPRWKSLLCSRHCISELFICSQRNLRYNFLCCLSPKLKSIRSACNNIFNITQVQSTHRVYHINGWRWLWINKCPPNKIWNPLIQFIINKAKKNNNNKNSVYQ